MKLNQYQNKTLSEDYVDIYYQQPTEKITAIIEFIERVVDEKVRVRLTDTYGYILLSSIYYIESVDRKYMANLAKESHQLQTDVTLKELAERFQEVGFVRVSKSLIVNVAKVEKVAMDLNMRMLAYLTNGEVVQINRSYKKGFNHALVAFAKEGIGK